MGSLLIYKKVMDLGHNTQVSNLEYFKCKCKE